MHELTQRFYFEAAHHLHRNVTAEEKAASLRIHGHTYTAAVTVRGTLNPSTGMVIDLAELKESIEAVRLQIDHHLLDEVQALRKVGPPTLEVLCVFIAEQIRASGHPVSRVEVSRSASGDSCTYYPS